MAVAVKTASVDTRHNRSDADLVSENFFDSEQFPAFLLRSTEIVRDVDHYLMRAHLKVRDITREIEIPVLVNRVLVTAGPQAVLELSRPLTEASPSADWHVIRARAHLALDDRHAAAQELSMAIDLEPYHTRGLAMMPVLGATPSNW